MRSKNNNAYASFTEAGDVELRAVKGGEQLQVFCPPPYIDDFNYPDAFQPPAPRIYNVIDTPHRLVFV